MPLRPLRAALSVAALCVAVVSLFATPAGAHAARKHHASKHRRHVMTAKWRAGRAHIAPHRATKADEAASPSAAPATAATGTQPQAQTTATRTSGPLFGVHTDRDPYYGNTDNTNALEQRLHRRIDIVHWFQNWAGDDWISQMHPEVFGAVTSGSRLPLLTWMPADGSQSDQHQDQFRLEAIASGRYDDYIASTARALRAIGGPIYLRPMHEFNGNWSPWGAGVSNNTPQRFIDAWRHMHDIFVREGATNVRWVWCPMAESVPDTTENRFERYYPGPSYVDVLSLDGYNWGASRPDMGGWRSFAKIFSDPVKRLTALGDQPIWLAEVGSASDGGDKAAWVRDMWKTVATWNRVEAVVWFDQNKERDWRATSSDAVADAFAAG